jgi:poly(3-hydroxybutyrate) depolymerase
VVVVALLALTATACEATIVNRINDRRADAGQPALPTTAYLDGRARRHAEEMCAAGAVSSTPDPTSAYGLETATEVVEVVDAAPLDPAIEDAGARNRAATDAIWSRWEDAPGMTDARWKGLGVGEVECDDGNLYMTAVLRAEPTMPASGRYSSAIYTTGQIQTIGGLRYGTAVNHQGATVDLLLDLYLPPSGGPDRRPLAILVHGGGFSGGSRADMAGAARSYAQRGFVAASISYRLRPSATLPELVAAASDGIDDGMESVRWLRSKAATYGIDPERIALVGSSAGGVIALGAATSDDPTPGGPLAAVSPAIAAGVSTGVSLTAGLDAIAMTPSDAPFLMFHYEQDTVALRENWLQAYQTCDAAHAGGVVCDFVRLPGSGHTVSLAAGGPWWSPEIGPFLWHHLDL